MRIAIIAHLKHAIGEPFAGGLETHTHMLAKSLQRRGHAVTVFASTKSDPALGVEAICDETSLLATGTNEANDVAFFREHHAYLRLMTELRTRDFDVIHNNSLHYLPVSMAATVAMPMVTTLHTPPFCWLESGVRLGGGRLALCGRVGSDGTAMVARRAGRSCGVQRHRSRPLSLSGGARSRSLSRVVRTDRARERTRSRDRCRATRRLRVAHSGADLRSRLLYPGNRAAAGAGRGACRASVARRARDARRRRARAALCSPRDGRNPMASSSPRRSPAAPRSQRSGAAAFPTSSIRDPACSPSPMTSMRWRPQHGKRSCWTRSACRRRAEACCDAERMVDAYEDIYAEMVAPSLTLVPPLPGTAEQRTPILSVA